MMARISRIVRIGSEQQMLLSNESTADVIDEVSIHNGSSEISINFGHESLNKNYVFISCHGEIGHEGAEFGDEGADFTFMLNKKEMRSFLTKLIVMMERWDSN